MCSMANVEKNVEAAQAFLCGTRTLSSYAAVLRSLEKCGGLTPAQAATLVQYLDPGAWRVDSMGGSKPKSRRRFALWQTRGRRA